MDDKSRLLDRLQNQFYAGAALLVPVAPILYAQGQLTRWKIGVLPDADGPYEGIIEGSGKTHRMLVIGESTVAGLGARDHERALAGQFARAVAEHSGHTVKWNVIGRNGVTARRTIDELLPLVPPGEYDIVLLGIGGNDVLKLSSPRKWRRDMIELLGRLQQLGPSVKVFVTNCPMIIYSPALPQPIRSILWRLSRMHDENIREFSSAIPNVFYFPQPTNLKLEGFWADGIHPSEQGYRDWADAMAEHFSTVQEW